MLKQRRFDGRCAGGVRGLDQVLTPGAAGSLRVDLQPGLYDLYCPVADHAGRGMRPKLKVTDGNAAYLP